MIYQIQLSLVMFNHHPSLKKFGFCMNGVNRKGIGGRFIEVSPLYFPAHFTDLCDQFRFFSGILSPFSTRNNGLGDNQAGLFLRNQIFLSHDSR
jgi:hypothetical protein